MFVKGKKIGFVLFIVYFNVLLALQVVTVAMVIFTVILPWLPGSAFMMVNTSERFAGQRAQLLSPQVKENDTHCVLFKYLVSGREGAYPGHLNIYIKENNRWQMGVPVWNASGPATQTWGQIELAVSTFWPNFYQVRPEGPKPMSAMLTEPEAVESC